MAVAELAARDVSTLDEDATLEALAQWQRTAACVEHGLLRTAAHFADLHGRPSLQPAGKGRERRVRLGGIGTPMVEEFAAIELGAELGMSSERASTLMADALDLRHRLPSVFAALGQGEVEGWRARIIARRTRELSTDLASQVESQILPLLSSVTTPRLKKIVAAAVMAADPRPADEAYEDARRECEVALGQSLNGVTEVFGRLETPDALRLDARVDQVADWLIELGDERPKSQLRAVALALLADPGEVERLRRRVDAHRSGSPTPPDLPVPATVLYVHHRRSLDGIARWELEGSGPISQVQAQQLVGTGFVKVMPVIDLADTIVCDGYRASDGLRQQTILTMPTCNGPFCDRPARKGDFDHQVPWPLGPTSSDNGALPCRRHHRARTRGRWKVRILARGA